MLDTGRDESARYHELLRAREPYERLAQAVALSRMVRELAIAGIQQRFPSASLEEVRVRLAVRLYGLEAARRMLRGVEVPADAR